MMTNHTTAVRRPSARLLARAARACLFVLLAFAGLTLACARRASAQTAVQAYSTSYGERPEDACGGRLVLVATSGSVKGNPAPAEAFSFVLVPRGEGKQRIFSVYSLGAAPRLRDDDEGQFALRPYDPQGIKNNLGTFFDKAGCKLDARSLDALSDALNKNATGLSVDKFARAAETKWPEGFANLMLVQSDRKNDEAWTDQESFARFVNGFGTTLPLPADGQVIALAKQSSEQKALADKSVSEAAELRRQVDSSFLLSRWVVALLIILGGLGLAYAMRRRLPAIPALKFFRKTGPPDAPRLSPEAADKLGGILRDSRKEFEEHAGFSMDVRTVLVNLRRAVIEFQNENQAAAPAGLIDILKRSAIEYRGLEASPARFTILYNNFWNSLNDYLTRHSPADTTTPTQDGAGESLAGAQHVQAQPAEVKPAAGDAPGQAAPAETPLTTQEFDGRLGTLEQNVNTLLSGLEQNVTVLLGSLEQNVVGRFSSFEQNVIGRLDNDGAQVRELCALWSEPNDAVPDGALDQVLERSRKARSMLDALRVGFGHIDLTPEESQRRILSVAAGLAELRKTYLNDPKASLVKLEDVPEGVKARFAESASRLKELEKYEREIRTTEEVLGILVGKDEDVFRAARRIADDQKQSLLLLQDYRPENSTDLAETVKSLNDRLRAAEGQLDDIGTRIKPVSSDLTGPPGEMVERLVEKFNVAEQEAARAVELEQELASAKSQARQGEELARTIFERLNFKASKLDGNPTPVATAIGKLTNQPPAHWRLRLGLSAAHDALAESLGRGAHGDLVRALSLDELKGKLADLLEDMQEFNGDEVWRKGIESGFATGWMHDLLRANLLLQSYFSEAQELDLLRDAVEEAGLALQAAMHEYRVRVAPVNVFGPKPDGMKRANPDEALLNLPEVRHRVKEVYFAKNRVAEFVVDAKTFSVVGAGEVPSIGRVVLMNPVDWGI